MFRKTKIVCTLGPSTDKEGVLKRLIEEGMNVARFNFSHGDHEEQLGRLQMLQKLRKELKRPVAALLDTKGPEIRLRDFTDGKVELKDGQTFTLTTDEIMGDAKRVSITYKNLPEDVKPGDRILIDDGLIGMEVKEIKVTSGAKADKDGNKPKDIICQVLNGGVISNRKGGSDWRQFDIVEGGIANDRIFNTIELYSSGLISENEALQRLIYEKPNNQICILNQDIIDNHLTFVEAREIKEEEQ